MRHPLLYNLIIVPAWNSSIEARQNSYSTAAHYFRQNTLTMEGVNTYT